MHWSEICKSHPNKWLIVEALEAHTTSDYRRHLNRLTVVEECPDGKTAMNGINSFTSNIPNGNFIFFIPVVIHLIFK